MTNLNEIIAKAIGWTKENKPPAPQITIWRDPTGEPFLFCPDFDGDANLYMQLFAEMPDPTIYKKNDLWHCVPDVDARLQDYAVEEHAELGPAICLAWCRMSGVEVG